MQTDGQTDDKRYEAFRNFANAPKTAFKKQWDIGDEILRSYARYVLNDT